MSMRLNGIMKRESTVVPEGYAERKLVECISSGRFDFIGVAMTPWHARMATACYLKLRATGQVDTGILLIDKHNKDGFLVSPEPIVPGLDVAYLAHNKNKFGSLVQAFICRLLLPPIQAKKSKGRVVYVANPSFPGSLFDSLKALTLDCRFSYILLDEGVGSYLVSDEEWVTRSIQDRGLHGFSALLRKYLSNYERKTLHRVISDLELKHRFDRFYLFQDNGRINSSNIDFVKRSFSLSGNSSTAVSSTVNKQYEGAVVFCSQFLLVEAGSLSRDAYFKAVEAANLVAKQLGVQFVVKVHPRETDLSVYRDFDAYIDTRRSVALEDILGTLNTQPLCISSLCSTAMVTASAIFGCRAIELSSFIPDEDTQESYILFYKRMRAIFGQYYRCPSTINEFYKSINKAN